MPDQFEAASCDSQKMFNKYFCRVCKEKKEFSQIIEKFPWEKLELKIIIHVRVLQAIILAFVSLCFKAYANELFCVCPELSTQHFCLNPATHINMSVSLPSNTSPRGCFCKRHSTKLLSAFEPSTRHTRRESERERKMDIQNRHISGKLNYFYILNNKTTEKRRAWWVFRIEEFRKLIGLRMLGVCVGVPKRPHVH